MKVLLVSLGSIGRRHLANLRLLEPATEVAFLRRNIEANFPERQFTTIDEAVAWKPDAAIICSPATQHLAVARILAERGIALFIEKPLADSTEGVAEFLQSSRVPVMVGYCLRFHPLLTAARDALLAGRIGRLHHLRAEVGQWLPDWRTGTDYRETVTARRELGGGALLELSHELDSARWLGGEVTGVSARVARLGELEINVEDSADITLQFASGAVASVHLDLLAQPAFRRCRLVGSDGAIEVDFLAGRAELFTARGEAEKLASAPADRNEMYLEELRHFLACVRSSETPAITGVDGQRVLEIIDAARRSSEEGRTIALPL